MRHPDLRRLTATLPLLCAATFVVAAGAAGKPAVVQKPSVDVHATPDLKAPTVATLKRDATVQVAAQQGLWYELALPSGKGFVRINEVRMAYAGAEPGGNARALFTGKAGKGRVTETAGVRGLDESDLQSAAFDGAQFAALEAHRISADTAASEARAAGWKDTNVAWAIEAKPANGKGKGGATQAEKRGGLSLVRGLLGSMGVNTGTVGNSAMDVADASAGKSEEEQSAEELALGPEIAGRVLGAAPLWPNEEAQRRVNRVGRWMASHTSRPELPWVFGVIDSPEVNAFAAPGGYILVTRGLYELLQDDGEVAAVLGHEISHVVQRDHYNVIRKQETSLALQGAAANQVHTGNFAAEMAKEYVRRHGASVLLTSLDREAEFRSDEASEIYLARAGFNPLALYGVLQKMVALGNASGSLAQLVRTHPALDDRLDRIDRRGYAGVQAYTVRE